MSIFSERVAIDLGTAYSIITRRHDPRFLRVASSIAYDLKKNKAIAFGDEAKKMSGRCPDGYEVVRPLSEGVIADARATDDYLDYLVARATKGFRVSTQMFLCVPWGATGVELRVYVERLKAPRRKIFIVREPYAAAIGAGLNILSDEPVHILDMGGGTTEIASIESGYVLSASSMREGGNYCDRILMEAFLSQFRLDIGSHLAENLKVEFGSVWPAEEDFEFSVRVVRRDSSRPESLSLSTAELRSFLEIYAQKVESLVQDHIRSLSSHAAKSLRERGVCLVGGTSLMKGWAQRISERLGIDVYQPERPELAVIRGLKTIIDRPQEYRGILRISERVHKS